MEIVGGNQDGVFWLHPDTGMLYTAKLLDAELKTSYALTVSALDQGNAGARKQSSARVQVTVLDANDNDPVFETPEQTVWVNENEPPGQQVARVVARDRDSGENAYISYLIANLGPVPFEVDHFTGWVRTTQVLNYEVMKREYVLRIRASDWGLPYRRQTETTLRVHVRDVNDNRPQFERVDCVGHVPRHLAIGTDILTLSAIDFDDGSVITYRLEGGSEDGCFALDSSSGMLQVTCDLADVRAARRELNVTASDGTHFSDVLRLQVNLVNAKRDPVTAAPSTGFHKGYFDCRETGVARRLTEVLAAAERNNAPHVADEEDFPLVPPRYGSNVHAPEFVDFPLEVRVNESLALGAILVRVRARDRDLGYNGKIVYGIASGDSDSLFKIDLESGELRLVGYLDRERESEYLLNVSAWDLGTPSKSTHRVLPVTVLDVNDNAPRFEKPLSSFRVTEDAANGTTIFRLNATDPDAGDNGRVAYSMETDTKDLSVDAVSGVLTVTAPLDRERQEVYEVLVVARDFGNPPQSSTAQVRVTVDDINDNPPRFALPDLSVRVLEDIPAGSVIAVVQASDLDLGLGGEVRYSLTQADDDSQDAEKGAFFRIDALTGTVRTLKDLDYEERQVHVVTVRATDRGTPALWSEAALTVHLIDVNENAHAPLFDDLVQTAAVLENATVGTLVTSVKASDADAPGDDSRITFSIRGGDGQGYFSIDDKGHVRTLVPLDAESRVHYWLTVVAQDHGVVPLSSRLELYIAVLDVNDNAPQPLLASYRGEVAENSPAGKWVAEVRARDRDVTPGKLTYRITAGNPENFFVINPDTGVVTTTERRLDRENQPEHNLEITVSDHGNPPLSSTTRLFVAVQDVNDNAPEFEQTFYHVSVPESSRADAALFQVLAFDQDVGPNGQVEYSIKSGRGKGKFRIHPYTGTVYSQKSLAGGSEYDLLIRAMDQGTPQRSATTRVSVQIVSVPSSSPHPPQIKTVDQQVQITESDKAKYLVALIQASDEDNDKLWFDIVDGDKRDEFYIGRDQGNVLLAKQLDYETQNFYNLTISVSDMHHTVYTQLYVTVLDTNEHRPEFSDTEYKVEVAESAEVGTSLLELHATDLDGTDRVFYSLHTAQSPTSLELFKLDSVTGILTLSAPLDCETMDEHVLTVMVKDQGTPSKRNYARVHVIVHDFNDHTPEFSSPIIQGRVYESAAPGSAVMQVLATDKDRGKNAEITYGIASGNVGNMFAIDPSLGYLTVARELDISHYPEYMLSIKASDNGVPALSATVPVHIMVTMADNAPPRFIKDQLLAEVYENLPLGTYVKHVEIRSTSSCTLEIVNGDDDGVFLMNPSTGVISTKTPLDYEHKTFYNLTVEATNMAGVKARSHVIVHVLDTNDNAPRFVQNLYIGTLLENVPVGSLVLTNASTPLVIKATDKDSDLNALLHYDIVENLPRKYFHIDSNTGAIRTVNLLDYETMPVFKFHVRVSDRGKPRLTSEVLAEVVLNIVDVNDCAPQFTSDEYNVTLLLPTYLNVAVLQVNATDRDSSPFSPLSYELESNGIQGTFALDSKSGVLTVVDPSKVQQKSLFKLTAKVSDGKFTSAALINIMVQKSENSGLVFQKSTYYANIVENSTKIITVTVVNLLGSALNEHIEFRILNPTDMFEIGETSGAIRTTGKRFDRELQEHHYLIVEARSKDYGEDQTRVAHVTVNVTIIDVNDNCPMFVNLPYYAVASVDSQKGEVITKVQAVDLDSGENGEVRYELKKGHGELFRVSRKSGEIILRQNLEGHNQEYKLLIAAYDGGVNPCSTDVFVHVKVIDRSMPVFNKQFYTVSVPENIELFSPLDLSISAESALGRKLIYSIVKGNDFEEFAVDFNTAGNSDVGTCVLYVIDELDYEHKQSYELTVRAVDSVSGVSSDVLVHVQVEDVNDCPPEFVNDIYTVSVSEAATFGSPLLKVTARDNDTGINAVVRYSIHQDAGNATKYFHIDSEDGSVYLKQALDREKQDSHHFTVIANDSGIPSLTTSAHVWVSVLDMNDNPPKFELPSYSCVLSEDAERGQFVTMVTASDADTVDQGHLIYSIVGGNDLQTFTIQPSTGIIRLINLHQLPFHTAHSLNVSVTDGVYTSFTRVHIEMQPSNHHDPVFSRHLYEATVVENRAPGTRVTILKATDADHGAYGHVSYSISSPLFSEIFSIHKNSGEVTTRVKLDREKRRLYELPVSAADHGGRMGHTVVRIRVIDENDNTPYFLQREYKASVHSNLTINSGFLKVKALDRDEDINAQVEYSIYEKESPGVKDLFGVNRQTGGLYLLKSALSYENQVFQFFVRAQDRGKPSRYADAPVEVYIMGSADVPPVFQRKDEKFFLSEKSPIGTVIAQLKILTNVSVSYRIVSGQEDSSLFAVDEDGTLTLQESLDREVVDHHHIAILAETHTSPSLVAQAEITLKVLDENDNAPQFHSNSYSTVISENVEEKTSVIKVTAEDTDQGYNGEVRYSIEQEDSNISQTFTIDPHSGWISTLVHLDRETRQHYKLNIVASDNGHPKHSTRCIVHIQVQDYNDNPPAFSNNNYKASVNEDALPGTVIIQLATSDADSVKMPVDLYIVSGDPASQLSVRSTGEVYVVRPLDRETVPHYNLQIIATDGKFVASSNVSIEILDANDNPPYCLRHRYRSIVPEDVDTGTFILSVRASDVDEGSHENLRFYLTGTGAEHFSLDKAGGHLRTAHILDRETQSKYLLTAHVQDRDGTTQGWECSSQVEILVADVNDNAPQFTLVSYTASLSEDAQVGTLVAKLHANDNDTGINRKVRYVIVEDDPAFISKPQFKITSDSGIVTLAHHLDREEKDHYNLTVEASDQGTPQLKTRTHLYVKVLDVNDNPPEFVSKLYHALVPELSPIDTTVVKVMATSKDIGVNAEISYSIVSGNGHKKFAIDSKTGVLSIREPLDYEICRSYFLTIEAIDGGEPPLSNQATINISISDGNDNAPIFNQPSYSARIREDADIGGKILQVTASDFDSEKNGEITYKIRGGDNLRQFSIDSSSGYISVAKSLDREVSSSHVLEVEAVDGGIPPLSSIALVNIDISDVNDNAPFFSEKNYTAVVQEDKPLGYALCHLTVSDADTFPNTEPFTFEIVAGNDAGMFRIEQNGDIRTAAKFNHKNKDTYVLQVRVFDYGLPPLSSDTWVVVKVVEESQYPPIVTPLEIWINSFQDNFVGGEVGRIHASDQDVYDQLAYKLVPMATEQPAASQPALFNIISNNGSIVASPQLDVGQYKLNVSVSDGKFVSYATIKVWVELVSDMMLKDSLSISFRRITAQDFLQNHRKGFIRAMHKILAVKAKDVILVSAQDTHPSSLRRMKRSYSNVLMVLFAVRSPNGAGFVPVDNLRNILSSHIEDLETSLGLELYQVAQRHCTDSYCAFGTCEDRVSLNRSAVTVVSTQLSSFVSPHHQLETVCHCSQGYSGERCDSAVNKCANKPCPDNMMCMPDGSALGYSCECPEGIAGPVCQENETNCQNVCYSPRSPMSMTGRSYAHYTITRPWLEKELNVSLRLRTLYPTGNIVYIAGQFDYAILEVVSGIMQFRFELGSGEGIVRVTSIAVDDGHWHEVNLQRKGNSARLVVDKTHVAQGVSPGTAGILNTQIQRGTTKISNLLYFGSEVQQHSTVLGFETLSKGFTGCLDVVQLWGTPVPLHSSSASIYAALKRLTNVQFTCGPPLPPGPCSHHPCLNGGTCRDDNDPSNGGGFSCLCAERFTGVRCERDTSPCASSPCLYGGRCSALPGGTYRCDCEEGLSGKRCEYGHFCSPNPCANELPCEEGDEGPLCKCLVGFTGELCSQDIDECASSPCYSGSTCVNTPGAFYCVCPINMTGIDCGTSVFHTSITSSIYNVTWDEILGITVTLFLIIFSVVGCICYRRFRINRQNNRGGSNINNGTNKDMVLNSTRLTNSDFKRSSKLSNLEVSQREPLSCPARPVSFTPSTHHEQYIAATLNNLDTLRSYGSAGDELENVPADYLRNLNRQSPMNVVGAPIQLPLSEMSKLNNGGKGTEDCYRSPGYHWDISDWSRPCQPPLPNITEVPGSEVPDSSSFHSDESNEGRPNVSLMLPSMGETINGLRDMETLNEEDCVDDSEDIDAHSYLLHPNNYLPHNPLPESDDEDVAPYTYNGRHHQGTSLLRSQSDLSTNLCDIDDSEVEGADIHRPWTKVTQTSV
ncbi:fat-like cadherin-related tumor suppressor homolog isoform X3 [Frankliniella occidentalis]|uniref:Fat-like cadherin-related tumor suppressor homolog isoform X3 n=1 Tax=Frankliniella occidentalis TaxID=133901 RepID=A0A9C6U4V3_FRAOC|nr:fat-like cadherin-related tumor suppressor homolog isoform X3 [Frankliniella occidentalis]